MWKYKILPGGFFYADGGAMFGAIPKRAWSRRYPSGDDNTCLLAMNCLLVWNQERVVALDTGVGTKDLGALSYYRFHEVQEIGQSIRAQGFAPEEVTDVVLSHLHFDHCGGCTYRDERGRLRITFPNARHWVSRRQWEAYLHPNRLEEASFRPSDMLPVFEAGLLQTIDEELFRLAPGFQLAAYGGHTEGQEVASFQTGDTTGVFAGDVIPTRAHLPDDWISAYDLRPLDSLAAKVRLKQEVQVAAARLFFYHDAYYSSI
jgi:glyoxylase-like metal-dependent hydrolase (beta-lactamase superfamily II)